MSQATLADVCAVACADAFRGDGEILASAIGLVPSVAVRFAKLTFEPDLLMTDGDALLLADVQLTPVGAAADAPKVVEGWMPFRFVFDQLWSGKRHVMMGATQIDRFGNQNIACIGPWAKPKAQLLGVRGAPGNTVNHPTSYWVPNHNPRVFVDRVDCVSGVGYDRAADNASAARYHEIRVVVSNKAVLDFDTPDHRMRLRSLHPGVTVDDVVAATGFELVIPEDVPTTRPPTDDEVRLIDEVIDPQGLRFSEVPHE